MTLWWNIKLDQDASHISVVRMKLNKIHWKITAICSGNPQFCFSHSLILTDYYNSSLCRDGKSSILNTLNFSRTTMSLMTFIVSLPFSTTFNHQSTTFNEIMMAWKSDLMVVESKFLVLREQCSIGLSNWIFLTLLHTISFNHNRRVV